MYPKVLQEFLHEYISGLGAPAAARSGACTMPGRKRSRQVPCHCPRQECRGQLRDHRTVEKHAKTASKDRAELVAGGVVACDEEQDSELSAGHEESDVVGVQSDPEQIDHATEILENLRDPVLDPDGQSMRDIPSVGEVVMLLCDWWIKNKASSSSAEQVWSLCQALLGRNNLLGEFQTVKQLLRVHRLESMRKVCAYIAIILAMIVICQISCNNSARIILSGACLRQHVCGLCGPDVVCAGWNGAFYKQSPRPLPGVQRGSLPRGVLPSYASTSGLLFPHAPLVPGSLLKARPVKAARHQHPPVFFPFRECSPLRWMAQEGERQPADEK